MTFGDELVYIIAPPGGSSDPVVSGVDVGVGVSGTSTTVSTVLSDRSTVVLSATATLVFPGRSAVLFPNGFFRLAVAVFRPWSTENKGTSSSLSSSSSLHSMSVSEEDFFVALTSFSSSSSIWPLFRRVRFTLAAPSLGCDRFDGRGMHSDWEPITCNITYEVCYNHWGKVQFLLNFIRVFFFWKTEQNNSLAPLRRILGPFHAELWRKHVKQQFRSRHQRLNYFSESLS